MTYLSMGAVQADAVFASGLQRCDELSAGQVRQAVAAAVRAFGRSGCAGRVAQEFGDHPDTAVLRMRWRATSPARHSRIGRPGPAQARTPSGWVVRPRRPAEQASGIPAAGRCEPARAVAGGEG
jgi:hypothetical protein